MVGGNVGCGVVGDSCSGLIGGSLEDLEVKDHVNSTFGDLHHD